VKRVAVIAMSEGLSECGLKESEKLLHDDEDEEHDLSEFELFDTSDITFDVQRTKGMCKLYVAMKSETPINLMRFYLALKEYLFQIEQEIGVMEEPPEMQ
jgi:hypothetical protein